MPLSVEPHQDLNSHVFKMPVQLDSVRWELHVQPSHPPERGTVIGSVLLEGNAAYENFISGYWSAQQAVVNPSCIFKPRSAL